MPYNFEPFNSFKGKFNPKISLGKSGGFGFSSGFMERYSLQNYHYLKIFFDKNKFAVAFQFFEKETEGAIKFKNRGNSGFFRSNSFLGKYNIDPIKYSNKYDPIVIKTTNMGHLYAIELKLNKEHQPISIENIPF
jgi:hypothetical protein